VLDDRTLLIPERPGNRRADSLLNIIENPHIGLLFLIPGIEETLRVNGRATIIRDPDLLARMAVQGKTPLLATAVEVQEAFVHCAKAFRRSRLWAADARPPRSAVPTLARMAMDQLNIQNCTLDELEQQLEESYRRLY
jgi:PPOX class probable FMN-dependent enzyme